MSDKFDENGKIVMDHTSKVMFFYAVMRDDFDIVRFRLEQNDDNINLVTDDGRTPLMCAKSTQMVELLCEYGAEVNQRDEKGMTALMHAAERVMELDSRDDIYDEVMHMNALIDLGADVYAVDNNGYSTLDRVDDELKEFILEEVEFIKAKKEQEDKTEFFIKYVLQEKNR